jgi:hypothetical protein
MRVRSGKAVTKILLQSKTTRDFVNHGGGWTWKRRRARVFSAQSEAIRFCVDHGILEMQVVCVFPDVAKNFTVAVTS